MRKVSIFIFGALMLHGYGSLAQTLTASLGKPHTLATSHQTKSLRGVLNELENRYHVTFFYRTNLIETATVNPMYANEGKTLERDLVSAIGANNLAFQKADNNLYVIVAKDITGKIKSNTGEAMPGVSILVKGSTRGAITDPDGNFKLNATAGDVLVVSFLGYETKEVKVTDETVVLNISLSESTRTLGEVAVIGSRAATARTNVDAAVPIDVITTKELKGFPQVDIGQILNYVAPSFNSNRQTVADGTDHVDPASLRGLGPDQVLVLVNGKRRHTSALVNINGTVGRGSVGTDMNVIPVAAIERIEVLRDGAAAQYGSDAIAGVINVVLKKDYQGTTASLTFGQNMTTMNYTAPNISGGLDSRSQKITDGQVLQFDFSKGIKIGKGGINISAQYNDRGKTNRSGEDNVPTTYLGANAGFPATPTGQTITDFRTNIIAADNALAKANGYNRQNMVFGNSSSKNLGLFINGGIPTGAKSEFYFSGGLTYRTGQGFGNYRVPVNRTQQPLKADGSLFYRDGFLPGIESVVQDKSLILGYKTKLGGWSVDLSNTYGINTFDFSVFNSGNATLPNADAQQTTFDAGQLKFNQNTTNLDIAKMFDKVGVIRGLNIAFGAEYRRDHYQITAGESASYSGTPKTVAGAPIIAGGPGVGTAAGLPGAQVFPGFQPSNQVDKSRTNLGIYADIEGEIANRLLVGVATRYENY
ncbi:MAG: TonB-dependent receptor, partial [Runella slithyformis]